MATLPLTIEEIEEIKKGIERCCGWPPGEGLPDNPRFCENWSCDDVYWLLMEIERLRPRL